MQTEITNRRLRQVNAPWVSGPNKATLQKQSNPFKIHAVRFVMSVNSVVSENVPFLKIMFGNVVTTHMIFGRTVAGAAGSNGCIYTFMIGGSYSEVQRAAGIKYNTVSLPADLVLDSRFTVTVETAGGSTPTTDTVSFLIEDIKIPIDDELTNPNSLP